MYRAEHGGEVKEISQGKIAEQPFVNEDGVFGSTLWFGRKKALVEMHVPRPAVARGAHPPLDFRTIALLDEDGAR